MIARVRGEHDSRGRWRLRASLPPSSLSDEQPGDGGTTGDDELVEHGWRENESHAPARGSWPARAKRWLGIGIGALLALVGVSVGYVVVDWMVDHISPATGDLVRPARVVLPATPRAWLDAYEAAAVNDPERVCSQLFAPALAREYAQAMHASCTSSVRRIDSLPLTVRALLNEGPTAVLELRQMLHRADWAVVLSRQRAGWQAVDVLPGSPLR